MTASKQEQLKNANTLIIKTKYNHTDIWHNKSFRVMTRIVIYSALGLYLINAILLLCLKPFISDFTNNESFSILSSMETSYKNISDGANSHTVIFDSSIQVIPVNSISVGVGLANGPGGYVDFTNSNDVILVDNNNIQIGYLDHEYAHILQKRLVTSVSGGVPSYWNPVQSFVYYVNLLRLNSDLEKYMPASPISAATLVPGLETNADCYSYYINNGGYEHLSYTYQTPIAGGCWDESYAAAISISKGEWPNQTNVEKYATQGQDIALAMAKIDVDASESQKQLQEIISSCIANHNKVLPKLHGCLTIKK